MWYDIIDICNFPLQQPFRSIFYSYLDVPFVCSFLSGNLPLDVREKEIDDIFYKFGDIKDIEIKRPARPPAFAFITFYDRRDAEDAVDRRDGYRFDGAPLRCELARDNHRRDDRRGFRGGPPRNTSEFRVIVKGLSHRTSWQDLKDFMRKGGGVLYTNVDDNGGGIVDFANREDMEHAIKILDDTELDGNRIELYAENNNSGGYDGPASPGGRGRSRSRSKSRSDRSRSPEK